MSATMNSDLKQIVVIGTAVLGIFVAGYMIQVERRAAVADRMFTDWIHENQLTQFVELFFKEGESISLFVNESSKTYDLIVVNSFLYVMLIKFCFYIVYFCSMYPTKKPHKSTMSHLF